MTIATGRELTLRSAELKKALRTLLNPRDFDDLGSEWKADALLDIEQELRDQAEEEAEAEEEE